MYRIALPFSEWWIINYYSKTRSRREYKNEYYIADSIKFILYFEILSRYLRKKTFRVQLIHSYTYVILEPDYFTRYMVFFINWKHINSMYDILFLSLELNFLFIFITMDFLFVFQFYNRLSGDIKTPFAWGMTLHVVNILRRVNICVLVYSRVIRTRTLSVNLRNAKTTRVTNLWLVNVY